ncbi:hypothetical protein IWW37_004926 [Coemansia sp. RSA 2050]|nr:hypothetical protein IWW37_004926 [Coemansia sp. RSA 2050]
MDTTNSRTSSLKSMTSASSPESGEPPETESQHATERPPLLASASICLLMFLIGLYTTMDAVLYVPIANEFNSLPRAEWIINSYLITTTAMQPIYGKVSDITGRSFAMVTASFLLLVGSVLSATAQSMDLLIFSRAIQGLGSAGLYTMVNVVIADLYNERMRGRFMGIASGAWSLSSSGAVVLGGVIVQYSTWRVAFWINVPICLIAAAIVLSIMHLPVPGGTLRDKLRRIDFGGSLLSLLAIVFILLALSWGGRDYDWGSAAVVCCLMFGTLISLLFIVYENRVPLEPIVPLHLLRTRNVALAFIGHLFFGAITYAPLMFIPQWALVVKNTTPITSGLYTLPITLTEFVAVVISGLWVTRSGRYCECVWLGSIMLISGLTPLILLDQKSGLGYIIGFQVIAGVGYGMCIQTLILTAQVSAAGRDSASATSVCLFMRSLGAILVVAVLSSVSGNRLESEFASVSETYPEYASDIARVAENQSLIHVLDLPPEVFNSLVNAFMEGMRAAFTALIPFSALFVATVVWIKREPLQTTKKATIE